MTRYPYDPDRARALLAEADWEDTDGDGYVERNGQTLEVALTVPKANVMEPLATLVQQYFEAVGIKKTVIDPVAVQRLRGRPVGPARLRRDRGLVGQPANPDILGYYHSNAAIGRNETCPCMRTLSWTSCWSRARPWATEQRKEIYDRER